jgi:hypothetical protein
VEAEAEAAAAEQDQEQEQEQQQQPQEGEEEEEEEVTEQQRGGEHSMRRSVERVSMVADGADIGCWHQT